jgi:hypothetical protein
VTFRDSQNDIDLRRPKPVGEVLGDALRCYGRHPALFLVLTLAVVVPYTLIVLLVAGAAPLGQQHVSTSAALIVILAAVLLETPLISALHVHAVVVIGEGRTPQLGQVAARGVRVLPVVAAAEVVAGIGTGVGFVLLIVPGVLLLLRWAVVAQTAAIEGVNWLVALRRSAELTRGHYLHVLAVILIVGVIDQLIKGVGGALVGSGAGAVNVVVGIAVDTITLSFAALTTAMLYFDLLARQGALASPAGEDVR